MNGIVLLFASLTAIQPADAGLTANAHQDRLAQPKEDYNYLYYFTTGNVPPDQRERLSQVLAFTVASLSSESQLDAILPAGAGETLYRIHTGRLGWVKSFPQLLRDHYPYSHKEGYLPLVVRADWFVQFVLDQRKSDQVYFQLLFGQEVKDLETLYKLLSAGDPSQFEYSHIESQSGVALNGIRIITTIPTARRTDLWQTFDFVEIDAKTDPLENLLLGLKDRQHNHDASELIWGLPKSLPGATGATGALQGYALANGQGQIQTFAPANIVVDSNGLRGPEINNAMDCISCHREGLRPLKANALRDYVQSGARVFVNDYKQQLEIERAHLTEITKFIERANADYAAAVWACNGLRPDQNAASLTQVIRLYDQDLDLRQAARELYVSPDELQNALGWWTAAGRNMSARLAQLAHGGTVPRTSWEDAYREALVILMTWRNSQKQGFQGGMFHDRHRASRLGRCPEQWLLRAVV